MMRATDLSVGDIGKTFSSEVYRDNNKTSKPTRSVYTRRDGTSYLEKYRTWTLETLYAHRNGNIKINNEFHLRRDTEIVEVFND